MILIIGAMASETMKIETLIKNPDYLTISSKAIVTGEIMGKKVMLATTGVGKTNAALTLSAILATYPIESIINVGLVGGFKPLHQGDMVIIKEAAYHDFDLSIFGYELGQVPQMPTYYPSSESLIHAVSSKLDLKHVRLYTGDKFLTSPLEMGSVCDMEGAALYQTAYLYQTPIISIKVVSDVVGEQAQIEDYELFEQTSSERFKSIIGQIL